MELGAWVKKRSAIVATIKAKDFETNIFHSLTSIFFVIGYFIEIFSELQDNKEIIINIDIPCFVWSGLYSIKKISIYSKIM